nr:MAG TPA: hypothetical protein [Caudoviricetes sp.]
MIQPGIKTVLLIPFEQSASNQFCPQIDAIRKVQSILMPALLLLSCYS